MNTKRKFRRSWLLFFLWLTFVLPDNNRAEAHSDNVVYRAYDEQTRNSSLWQSSLAGKRKRILRYFDGNSSSFDKSGQKMLFVSNRRNRMELTEIFLHNFKTKSTKVLEAKGNTNVSPSFSPHGNTALFAGGYSDSRGPDHDIRIKLKNINGKHERILTKGPDDYTPRFSSDGKKIVFMTGESSTSPDFFTNQRCRQIEIMDMDGGNRKRLTNTLTDEVSPVFNPNGTQIVFVSFRDGNSEIYAMNVDGTEVRRLTNNAANDQQPAVSSDGRFIAWSSNRTGKYQIYVMRLNGTGQRQLTSHNFDCFEPVWRKSP